VSAPAFRLCPLCSRPASRDHDCPRRHPAVRVTRLPRQADAVVAEAFARAWDDHRPDDAASVALDALRAELRAIEARAVELVREPGARGSLRLQTAEEAVLRAADALRVACGVGL
jgi:hypothetical protein